MTKSKKKKASKTRKPKTVVITRHEFEEATAKLAMPSKAPAGDQWDDPIRWEAVAESFDDTDPVQITFRLHELSELQYLLETGFLHNLDEIWIRRLPVPGD